VSIMLIVRLQGVGGKGCDSKGCGYQDVELACSSTLVSSASIAAGGQGCDSRGGVMLWLPGAGLASSRGPGR
jgi:hypothetical protein